MQHEPYRFIVYLRSHVAVEACACNDRKAVFGTYRMRRAAAASQVTISFGIQPHHIQWRNWKEILRRVKIKQTSIIFVGTKIWQFALVYINCANMR